MKRMLSLALVLLLALSLFAGCGGNNTQNNHPDRQSDH